MGAPNNNSNNKRPQRPKVGQPRPGMQQPKKKTGGKVDPMSNMRSKGRYGMKLIRDIAYGNFNIFTQGHVFQDMDLVNATLNEVNNKLFDIQIHINAITYAYQGCTDQRVANLLWRDQQQAKAYGIMQQAMAQISATGDVGHLLILANCLPPLRHNI